MPSEVRSRALLGEANEESAVGCPPAMGRFYCFMTGTTSPLESPLPPAQRTNRTSHLHFLTPAPNRNVLPAPRLPRTIQQTPRLPIFLPPDIFRIGPSLTAD